LKTRIRKEFRLVLIAMGLLMLTPILGRAQGTQFPDVKENHWAYAAVKNLADKGLVKGYPDGQFLGQRAMTRYEFATVIDRLLQTLADLQKPQAAEPAPAPASSVTPDDLNKIQVLVDEFKTELTAIQSDLKAAQDNIDALRQDVMDAKDLAAKAQDTASASYGYDPGQKAKRKFTISGYIQARYIGTSSDDQKRFPHGSPTANSPYNGNYAQGGYGGSFLVRRSRIKFTGAVTDDTKYAIQLDTSGATTTDSTKSGFQAVSIREANIAYKPGGRMSNNPTFTIGMQPNPFGYELPTSAADVLTPEKPLAFNEGSAGLFNNQDFDRGVTIAYSPSSWHGVKATAGLLNGTGLASNDVDRVADQVYRVAYQSTNKVLGVGASYYNGQLPGSGVGMGLPAVPPAPATPSYRGRKKQLTGFDAQYVSPAGPFLMGEYVDGTYEQRSYFASPTATSLTTNVAYGNKVNGYYVQGGWTFSQTGDHPLTLGASYDVLRRSASGAAKGSKGGASGSTFDDKNFGYGILYGLDKQTRFRLWYIQPDAVAHAAGTATPSKFGLTTGEIQVRF
jgi:hypothetical protein